MTPVAPPHVDAAADACRWAAPDGAPNRTGEVARAQGDR
jgi:hypothetical protein